MLYDYHWVVDTFCWWTISHRVYHRSVVSASTILHVHVCNISRFEYSVYMYMYVLFAYLLTKSFKSFGYKVIPETRRAN